MLRARHNFIAAKVVDAFGVSDEDARASVRKYLPKVNEFFAGETGTPSHLLVYKQVRDIKNEVCLTYSLLLAQQKASKIGCQKEKNYSSLF